MAITAYDMEYDHLFKVVVVGKSGAGKTSISKRFVNDKFNSEYKPTIGVEFAIKEIQIEGKKVKLHLWDTAGQERFRPIVGAYYRGAQGIISVIGLQKFNDKNELVKETVKEFKDRAKSDIDICLSEAARNVYGATSLFLVLSHADEFANKIPDAVRSAIQQELLDYAQQKAEALKKEFNNDQLSFNNQLFLVSAKTGEGVDALFAKAAQVILNKAELALKPAANRTLDDTKGSAKPMGKGKQQAFTMGDFFKKNKYSLLALLLLMALTAAMVLTVLFPPMGLAAMIPTMATAVGLGGLSTAVLAVIAGAATLAMGAMIYSLFYFAFGRDSVKGKSAAKSAKISDDEEQLLPKGAPASTVPTPHPAEEVVGSRASYKTVIGAASPATSVTSGQPPVSGQTLGLRLE